VATRWIEHKGKRIFIGEFNGLDEEAYLEAIESCKNEILAAGHPRKSLRFMTWCDSFTTERITAKWREFDHAVGDVLLANAIVGLTGFRRVLAKLVRRDLYFAKDEEDAKEWIVAQ
jgi:hypothetical protein